MILKDPQEFILNKLQRLLSIPQTQKLLTCYVVNSLLIHFENP